MGFPAHIKQISKQWLYDLLTETNTEEMVHLDGFSVNQIGEEGGASGQLYRLNLYWEPAGSLPQSIVLKFASEDPAYREHAKNMGTYLKEVRFYQTYAEDLTLPIPKVYFAEFDTLSGDFLLVLEDLSDARMANWFSDSSNDVEVTLSALAQIHAKFWCDPKLDQFGWLNRADDIEQAGQYRYLLEQLLPVAKTRFGGLISDYGWRVMDAWLKQWEDYRNALSTGAHTMVHREADMRQMFFPTETLPRFILFDWQSPEIGWGACDVCRMMVTSLDLDTRRRSEVALVKCYLDALVGHGINDLTEEALWRQIKLSLPMNLLAHMFSLLWVQKEETDVWQSQHLGILGAALEDWQLFDLFDGLG